VLGTRPAAGSVAVVAEDIRARLRGALPVAMKERDKPLVAVLRTTLAALDNAGAVPTGPDDAGGLALEATPVGVGAREVPRRELDDAEVERLVRAEVTERREAARMWEDAGQPDQAERLRREADALAAVAGLPTTP
jgi:uncharacterized protein YqeY